MGEDTMGVGMRLGGRFVLRAAIGRGGMGVVFPGWDERDGGYVALKVLSRAKGSAMARFVGEASILADLRHPHIVRYRAHGSDRGHPWLAMDWLAGATQRLLAEPGERCPAARCAPRLGRL